MKQSLVSLAQRWPRVLSALGELLELADGLAQSLTAPKTPYPIPELAERVTWGLHAVIHPALVGHESVVMDTVRDLMEISSLALEFTTEPHRIPKWTSGHDRGREFGYAKLVRKEAERGMNAAVAHQLINEYRAHSEALHPAANDAHPAALTKRPVELDVEWWLPLMFFELFRHGVDAIAQLENAARKLSRTEPTPGIDAIWDSSVLRSVMVELEDYQKSVLSNGQHGR